MGKPLTNCSKAIALGCALIVATTSISLIPSNDGITVEATSDYNYARGLQYSLYLYDANMCGTEVGETSALTWRDDCHTDDAYATDPNGNTVDVSGGYHDAGDHVKFGLPQAYSASILGWGYYEFKDAYTQTGQAEHMETISTYFAEYFKNCTVMDSSGNVTAFCYQVGDGTSDHNEWCSPEDQDIDRPTYWATSSNPATDIVSNTVGALAFHYANFGDTEALTYAKALYQFAKNNNKAVATQGVGGFYDSNSYIDDLMWAAAALYTVTGDTSYVSDANQFLSDFGNSYAFCSDHPLCWGNMWPAVNLIFGQLSSGITNEWGSVNSQMMSQVKTTLDTFQSKTTLEGTYVCFDNWGGARYNTAMQLVGLVYDKINGGTTYTSWAKTQMDYLMGNNSSGTCYITGFSDTSVTNPHHRAASGLSDFPTENTTITMGHTLIGALVGGPDQNGSYVDQISQYTYTEVAIDYNAGFVGALAGLYLQYGSGQSVDSTIEGVNSSSNPVVTTVTTTSTTDATTTTYNTSETTSTTTTSVSGGNNLLSSAQVVYNNDGTTTLVIYINTDDSTSVDLTLSGLAGYTTSGQVGYWDNSAQQWVDSVDDWSGKTFDSNGNLNISDLTVPANTDNVQIMVTYYADWSTGSEITGDMSGINIISVTGHSTSSTTTTDTTTTTAIWTNDTTTTTSSESDNIVSSTEVKYNSDGTSTLVIYVNTDDSTSVDLTLSGLAGYTTSGQVGYWDNSTQQWIDSVYEWENQKFDSNGNLIISDITVPANTDNVQIMITYYADWSTGSEILGDMSGISVISVSENSTTYTTTTDTTTQTTTASSDVSSTTTTTGNITSATLLGDVNCDGTISGPDLVLLKRYVLGLEDSMSDSVFNNADIDRDGNISGLDLIMLKKYILGLITTLE